MRRTHVLLGLFGAVALTAFVTWLTFPTRAQQPAADNTGTGKAKASPLPVSQVILFSSGVGYFQREGHVEGNAHVDLAFPATDVNDLLKSLVLQDLGGGKVGVISYDSHDPIEKTLRSFALDLTYNPSFGQLINQARGEKVEVSLQQTNTTQPRNLNGIILGMESQRQPAGNEIDLLNILCTEGIRSIPLTQVERLRFLNPALESELRRALEVLSSSHDALKKTVSLSFNGEGKRPVRVGYVVENPMWKTSYRLVLDKNGKPLLQGWAMVENTTDEDWKDVRMVLISSRPISFQMNLYQPLYVPRPTVEPELFASLRPPAYGGNFNSIGQFGLQGGLGQFGNLGVGGGMNLGMIGGMNLGAFGAMGGQFGIQGGNPFNRYQLSNLGIQGGWANLGVAGGMPPQPGQQNPEGDPNSNTNPVNPGGKLSYEELQKRRQQLKEAKEKAKETGSAVAQMDPGEGIEAFASGEEVGDHFQYLIDQKINLPRQKSALLPIINHNIEATRVSIYNERIQQKHPLLGLKIKNTTGNQLMQGPITVYEGGSYAGDARVLDLQPNEERLLSYAVDLATEVRTQDALQPDRSHVSVKLVKDALHVGFKMRHTRTYHVKNRSEHERTLMIEHPIRGDWELAGTAKPAERTRDTYRFKLVVPAGKVEKLDVVEEQPRTDQVALSSASNPTWSSTKGGEQPRTDPVVLSSPDGRQHHYALHGLGAELQLASKALPEELTALRIVKGEARATYRFRETKTYVLRNLTDKERTFVIDHLARPGWDLVGRQNTDDQSEPSLRVQLKAAAGKTVSQEVTEEQTRLVDKLYLRALAEQTYRTFLDSKVVSDRAKEALRKSAELAQRGAETRGQVSELEAQLKTLTDDQGRLRANLGSVPKDSAAYKRYLEKFDKQEPVIESLQEQIRKQQDVEKKQQKEYDNYLANLTVE